MSEWKLSGANLWQCPECEGATKKTYTNKEHNYHIRVYCANCERWYEIKQFEEPPDDFPPLRDYRQIRSWLEELNSCDGPECRICDGIRAKMREALL